MQKLLLATLLAALVCTSAGCNARRTVGDLKPDGEEKTETQVQPERVDGLHNPILTKYAEGDFAKVENGKLYVDENGTTRAFSLSERAKKDIQVLGVGAGSRIIVNYNVLADGTEEAESLEKILSE